MKHHWHYAEIKTDDYSISALFNKPCYWNIIHEKFKIKRLLPRYHIYDLPTFITNTVITQNFHKPLYKLLLVIKCGIFPPCWKKSVSITWMVLCIHYLNTFRPGKAAASLLPASGGHFSVIHIATYVLQLCTMQSVRQILFNLSIFILQHI
jgi:hypothetical protein